MKTAAKELLCKIIKLFSLIHEYGVLPKAWYDKYAYSRIKQSMRCVWRIIRTTYNFMNSGTQTNKQSTETHRNCKVKSGGHCSKVGLRHCEWQPVHRLQMLQMINRPPQQRKTGKSLKTQIPIDCVCRYWRIIFESLQY